jgi:DNA repair protein RadC
MDTQTSDFPPHESSLRTLPLRERPTHRVGHVGAGVCAAYELLAAIIGGSRQLDVARRLLARYGSLGEIVNASVEELAQVEGLGPARAAALQAALELGRRLTLEEPGDRPQIHNPGDVARILLPRMSHLEQEELVVVFLNTRHRVLGVQTLYRGSLGQTQVRVGEVFREAVRRNCASIAIAHNHPSGDPSPSPEDVALTRDLVAAGNLLSIEVLDHLIIGRRRWVSLRERGVIS